MLKWLSPTASSSYTLKDGDEIVFFEKYRQLDEFQEEDEVKQNVNRVGRRFAVLWEPVKDSNKSIPVFVKSEK